MIFEKRLLLMYCVTTEYDKVIYLKLTVSFKTVTKHSGKFYVTQGKHGELNPLLVMWPPLIGNAFKDVDEINLLKYHRFPWREGVKIPLLVTTCVIGGWEARPEGSWPSTGCPVYCRLKYRDSRRLSRKVSKVVQWPGNEILGLVFPAWDICGYEIKGVLNPIKLKFPLAEQTHSQSQVWVPAILVSVLHVCGSEQGSAAMQAIKVSRCRTIDESEESIAQSSKGSTPDLETHGRCLQKSITVEPTQRTRCPPKRILKKNSSCLFLSDSKSIHC